MGPVALTAELANYAFESDALHVVHSAAVSARWTRGAVQPYAAYTLSFSLEDDVVETAHAVTAGVQAAF